ANPIIQMIEKDTASFPTSVNPPVGHFLYSITRLLRPRLIIETGCYIGYSTLCMAEALARNQSGHIHSFDLFLPLPDTYSSPFLPGCRDSLLVAHAHAEKAGLANYVTFHKGDSSSSIPQVLSAENSALDLAFIDGDHWIRGCFKDWEAVLNLLCPGGIVLLHDTAPKNCGWCGPHTLIRECQKQSQSFQALNLPTPDGYGMGIIQKIGERMPGQWKPSFLDLAKEFLQMKIWWRGHKAVGKH
ncbi:MAG: class I SAM-dependent methyltransferase, partial [Candidatus Sumerlaeota bacterium]|nr:class I SAM-dependent methyltransferase [Candidatus Sumerlaeota bacterium]